MTDPRPSARFLAVLRSNWITHIGAILTTLAFLAFVTTFLLQAVGVWTAPYLGLITFVTLPMIFVAGLVLIPIGFLLYRGQLRERIQQASLKPRRLWSTVFVLTAINFVVVAVAGQQGVSHMSSNQFCGVTCHSVMAPEYVA